MITSLSAGSAPHAAVPLLRVSGAAPSAVAEPQDVVVARPQSLASLAAPALPPLAATDHDWSSAGRTAAIVAGVLGGATVAAAVAYGAAVGGIHLGAFMLNGMYQEPLARSVAMSHLLAVGNHALLAAPALGAVAGGVVGGIAAHKKPEPHQSDVPGSGVTVGDRQDPHIDLNPLDNARYAWSAVKTQFREAGEKVHEGVNGVRDAESLGEAVRSGASAGYAFGSRLGNVGGRVMGLAQGACLGALFAGLPFAFSPLTAIPVAFVGAWGISGAMSRIGGLAAGAVGGVGGAVAGAAGYGLHKVTGPHEEQGP